MGWYGPACSLKCDSTYPEMTCKPSETVTVSDFRKIWLLHPLYSETQKIWSSNQPSSDVTAVPLSLIFTISTNGFEEPHHEGKPQLIDGRGVQTVEF
jgi:hypothetical protein